MADNKKEKVYAAVLELFKEGRKIKDIKVSDIANKAGIGKGSIYLYFASKDAVIVEAAQYFFDTWLEPFNEFAVDTERNFKDIIMEFMDIHLQMLDEYTKFFDPTEDADFINVFNSNTLPGTIEIARNARLQYLSVIEKILNAGIKQGIISYVNRYSINVVAESIMLMLKYLGFKDVLDEEEVISEEQFKELTYDMILRVCR